MNLFFSLLDVIFINAKNSYAGSVVKQLALYFSGNKELKQV
jgi:hypothetical protein